MMSNNKILTVSYGTFSCTLEGFDDSFGTMKAIAEYFRGLSSDAPYFGAEPPQPDAEMLARIAQKEISRRVEAREHEGKIHLSAIEKQSEAPVVAPAAQLKDVAEDNAPTDTPIAEAVEEVAPVAARVDSKAHVPEAAPIADVTPVSIDVAEKETAATETVKASIPEAAFLEDENDIVPGQPDADVEAFFANSPDATPALDDNEEDVAETVEPVAAPVVSQSDSIAAKLQRIRAVVAQHDDVEAADDFAEDQHADAETADAVEPDHLMADARRDIEDALDADEAADLAVETTDDENDDDDIAAILGRLDAADAADASGLDEDIVAVAQTSKTASDATDDALDNLFGADEEDDVAPAPLVAPVAKHVAPQSETSAQQEAPRTPRARVIKVKRADLEAAIEKGELEEYVDEQHENVAPTLDDLAPARHGQTSLSAEDEAELARELAELEADMSPSKASSTDDFDDEDDAEFDDYLEDELEAADEDEDQDEVTTAAAVTSRRVLPSMDDAKGNDMDRLLAETDQQMGEPESATRRDAFSHLRAAVAAKKADVAMGAKDQKEDEGNAYRSDLADVVRPRRPSSNATRSERPGDARPAPLKLVAEQRIDVAKPRLAGPVRPRRVAAVVETPSVDPSGESFADYAAEMGATKLPQLLEAAASYMAFVEGREQFSRPQLMTKVRQVGPEDGFSREDGLRSFGQLLRAGKIEKIKGGRFTVSDDIGYRPDHRAAG